MLIDDVSCGQGTSGVVVENNWLGWFISGGDEREGDEVITIPGVGDEELDWVGRSGGDGGEIRSVFSSGGWGGTS